MPFCSDSEDAGWEDEYSCGPLILLGDTVEICDLVNSLEFNGRRGAVRSYLAHAERYGVQLDGCAAAKAFRPFDLKLLHRDGDDPP